MVWLKAEAPIRNVTEVGPGDFVRIGRQWIEILSNTAHGAPELPKSWSIECDDGNCYGMFSVDRYAKQEDFE